MAAVSPSSSPRLPSPPPIAEDQVAPTSPGVPLFEEHRRTSSDSAIDIGASRRIRPGTKAEDMAEGPPLVELQEIESAFQLTEHLKALYYSHTHPANSGVTVPITLDIARELAQPPANTNKEIWLYELGRFLIQKTNAIIVGLFADQPPCSAQTCPEMRASEWQYLCAVHDPPKSCSAIDYCCHTLDWAATSLTSSKMFPSRLDLGSKNAMGGNDKVLQQQMKEITNIFRRGYRIYAHAWFQHRDMFWRVEGKTGLYIFFKTVCDEYGLIQHENYTIPQEAEGLEPDASNEDREMMQPPSVLKRDPESGDGHSAVEPMGSSVLARGDTTKRHRQTRGDLSNSVATAIQEEAEDADEAQNKPVLGRQTTAVHDSEALGEERASDEAKSSEQRPTVSRSDTLRASKDSDQGEVGEETIIALDIDQKPSEPAEPSSSDANESENAPPPPEADEATKSVED